MQATYLQLLATISEVWFVDATEIVVVESGRSRSEWAGEARTLTLKRDGGRVSSQQRMASQLGQ